MIEAIEALLEHDRAGDPMTGLQWTRRTTEKIARELEGLGIEVCPNTAARILKRLGFSLRVNHKTLCRRSDPDRDEQLRSDALGIAVPYGVYDPIANRGSLYVGTSHDTPEFAADNLTRWWCTEGEALYPDATDILVLADGGGSNG